MNLGQVTSGPVAVQAFQKGIELVKVELKEKARRGVRQIHAFVH